MKKIYISLLIFISFCLHISLSQTADFNKLIEFPGDVVSDVIELSDGSLYALSNYEYYLSEDMGKTWTKHRIDLPLKITFNAEISSSIIGQQTNIFFYTRDSVYMSEDLGENWSELKLPGEVSDPWVNSVYQAPDGNIFLSISSWNDEKSFLFMSKNNGSTFEKCSEISGTSYEGQVVFQYNEKTFVSNTEGTYILNIDDNSLSSLETPFKYMKSVAEANGFLFGICSEEYMYEYDLFSSSDDGETWSKLPMPDNRKLNFSGLLSDGNNLIVDAYYSSSTMSYDYIIKYDFEKSQLKTTDSADRFHLLLLKSGTIFNFNGKNLEKSNDFGRTWVDSYDGMTGVFTPVTDYDKDGNYYLLMIEGDAFYYDNENNKYSKLNLDLRGDFPIRNIVVCDNGNVVMNTSAGILYSEDNGLTWYETEHFQSDEGAYDMDEISDDIYFVKRDSSIYVSEDNGVTAQLVKKFDFPIRLYHELNNGRKFVSGRRGLYELTEDYQPSFFGFDDQFVLSIENPEETGETIVFSKTAYTSFKLNRTMDGENWESIDLSFDAEFDDGLVYSTLTLNNGIFLITSLHGIIILKPGANDFEFLERFAGIPCFFIEKTYDGKYIFPAFDGFVYEIISKPGGVDFRQLDKINNVFPNPADDIVRIHTSVINGELSIFDSRGRIVGNTKIDNNDKIEYDAGSLPRGTYHYRITNGENSEYGSFVISR